MAKTVKEINDEHWAEYGDERLKGARALQQWGLTYMLIGCGFFVVASIVMHYAGSKWDEVKEARAALIVPAEPNEPEFRHGANKIGEGQPLRHNPS